MARSSQHIFSSSPYIRRSSALSRDQLGRIDTYLHALLTQQSDQLRKTHYFHGRYENIYLDNSDHKDLIQLLDEGRDLCARLIDVMAEDLITGFWFNLMQPGHITDWHTHDDMDEVISGVVYLTVPKNSGNLVLRTGNKEIELEPEVGDFIFFDPKTPHVVRENRSQQHRLSIGMNMGLKANQL